MKSRIRVPRFTLFESTRRPHVRPTPSAGLSVLAHGGVVAGWMVMTSLSAGYTEADQATAVARSVRADPLGKRQRVTAPAERCIDRRLAGLRTEQLERRFEQLRAADLLVALGPVGLDEFALLEVFLSKIKHLLWFGWDDKENSHHRRRL